MKGFFILIFSMATHAAFAQSALGHYHRAIADSLYASYNYTKALKHFEKALSATSDKSILLSQARCYYHLHKLTDAEKAYSLARNQNITFTAEDHTKYIQVLNSVGSHDKAVAEMERMNSLFPTEASRLFNPFVSADSSRFSIEHLTINTAGNEFGAVPYNEGIIFAASLTGKGSGKKYHRDESPFLDLYYSRAKDDGSFSTPETFDITLKNLHHNGPVCFFDNENKMLLTRNVPARSKSKTGEKIHFMIYQGSRPEKNTPWAIDENPIFESSAEYSYGQAFVWRDSILYFVSDQPGGFGGTDIYKSLRKGNNWATPENLGSSINTSGREMFPSISANGRFIFASDGHGGFGGLDIFELTSENKVSPLPFPINSFYDDFAMITEANGKSGLFTSSRNAQDDLFRFVEKSGTAEHVVHIYNSDTKADLARASVQIFTTTSEDISLIANDSGYVYYKLPPESDYVLIASGQNRSGMLSSSTALQVPSEKMVHEVAAFGDLEQVHTVGRIRDSHGNLVQPKAFTVTDLQTKEVIDPITLNGLVYFQGVKGHSYQLTVFDEGKDSLTHLLSIPGVSEDSYEYELTLNEQEIDYVAHFYVAESKQDLSDATVELISYENDLPLRTNSSGNVNYKVKPGTAYLLIGTTPGRTGMLSTEADSETRRYEVPAYGENNSVPAIGKVENSRGEPVKLSFCEIIDIESGARLNAETLLGLVHFQAQPGRSYKVKFLNLDNDSVQQTLTVPQAIDGNYRFKIDVPGEMLKTANQSSTHNQTHVALGTNALSTERAPQLLTAHIFEEVNNAPLPGAHARIITMMDEDQELIADSIGNITFDTPQEAFLIISKFQNYTGAFAGQVGENFLSPIPVPSRIDPALGTDVVIRIFDVFDQPVTPSDITIINKRTGEQESTHVVEGLALFTGQAGQEYSISILADKFQDKKFDLRIDGSQGHAAINKRVVLSHDNMDNVIVRMRLPNQNSDVYLLNNKKLHRLNENDNVKSETGMPISYQEISSQQGNFQNQKITFEGQKYEQHISIDPLYFAFNSSEISEEGMRQLDKLTEVLRINPGLKLHIVAHADDRGSEAFNDRLSDKRARSVINYFSKGTKRSHFTYSSLGETRPVIDCHTQACSEADHRLNRRAIFEMISVDEKPASLVKDAQKDRAFQESLKTFGDIESDGLVYKITLGAYRYNHTLTFENLSDLGTVEMENKGGIAYYYLSQFNNLNQTESVRQKVIKRGVTDAGIRILYEGRPISLSKIKHLK